MFTWSPRTMSPSLQEEDGAAAEEHAAADVDPAVAGALGVEHAQVVDDHPVADPDLAGMAQHDAGPERDALPATPQQQRVGELAEHEPERAGDPGGRA